LLVFDIAEETSMASDTQPVTVSKGMLWTGRVMGGLVALFLLMDGVMKLVQPDIVVKTTVQLGYPESVILGLGIVLLACTVLSLIPRTSVLGAILLTGYLGGAVASHVRAQDDAFSVLFPVILGALLWGGLVLRDGQLRHLLPIRR
jgi:hypothetical protein